MWSPLLFCIYIDELFERLRLAIVGCFVGNVYVGNVSILAMCVSLRHLVMQFIKCFSPFLDLWQEYNVNFNSSKSQVMVCIKDNIVVTDKFYFEWINIYNSVQHLGRDVGDSDYNCKAVNKAIGELSMRTNYVKSKFGVCSSDIRNFSFVLIVQTIMAVHCGVHRTNVLISFIVLGENVFGVYGIYQIIGIVSSWSIFMGIKYWYAIIEKICFLLIMCNAQYESDCIIICEDVWTF